MSVECEVHGGDADICPPCQRAADQGHGPAVPQPRTIRVIVAERTSYCPACDRIVLPGDDIGLTDDGWAHHPDCTDH